MDGSICIGFSFDSNCPGQRFVARATVDPTDDATFWYVSNYLKSVNTTTPATRIGSL